MTETPQQDRVNTENLRDYRQLRREATSQLAVVAQIFGVHAILLRCLCHTSTLVYSAPACYQGKPWFGPDFGSTFSGSAQGRRSWSATTRCVTIVLNHGYTAHRHDTFLRSSRHPQH